MRNKGFFAVLGLVLGVFVARVAYLIWLSPYELVNDEAQYWVWSRHLDLSYYSKGPGVAWVIAASTHLFGHVEWAVRLPAAVSNALSMWFLAMFARDYCLAGWKAGFLAALMFSLIPGYQATAQLMTIDAPFFTCWIIASWTAFRIAKGGSDSWTWLMLAASLGIGFLFKYTILLLIPGLLLFVFVHRRPWSPLRSVIPALLLFALIISPVFLWNQSHGWPTLSHLLGHLGTPGGDMPTKPWAYNPLWTLRMIGGQAGIIGPLMGLMFLAAMRDKLSLPVCAALPVLGFYALLTIGIAGEENWMLAGYTTLLVPTSCLLCDQPNRTVRLLWLSAIVYGCASLGAILFPGIISKIPLFGKFIPMHRIEGHKAEAARVQNILEKLDAKEAGPLAIIANQYGRASLLSFYLPGHPVVHSSSSWMGGRLSSHDFFPDTALTEEKITGRPVILVGESRESWSRGFRFEKYETLEETLPVLTGSDFRGRPVPAR